MKYAFEPFGSLQGILSGEPFRILPLGKWYRENRILDITPERLMEMASNIKNGLPNFRPPINLDHRSDAGKVGTVLDADYLENGPDGSGLYATKYELTEKGKKAVSEDGYDAVSGEVVWTLYDSNGKYQNPKTGSYHDNVLVGIGLTPKPYFGHNEVALFSSIPTEKGSDAMVEENKLTTLINMFRAFFADAMMECPECKAQMKKGGKCPQCGHEDKSMEGMASNETPDTFRDYNTEQRKEMAKKGHAMPDGAYPIADAADLQNAIHAIGRGSAPHATIKAHIMKRAKALGKMDMLPEDWTKKGDNNMSDQTPVINVEEFNALKEKAEQFDTLKRQADEFAAKLEAEKARADNLAEQFTVERKARAIEGLKVRAEKFAVALPGVKPDEYAEKFYVLGEQNAELAKWFMDKFDAINTVLAQSAVFTQLSRDNAANADETIETLATKIVTEKFSGDMKKYGDALVEAGKQRPDLAEAYANLSHQ